MSIKKRKLKIGGGGGERRDPNLTSEWRVSQLQNCSKDGTCFSANLKTLTGGCQDLPQDRADVGRAQTLEQGHEETWVSPDSGGRKVN